MNKYKTQILLWVIIIFAFGLRVILINQSPPSLYWEEAALGYDAWSILKTGKDYHGHPWPIVAFESFGDWKPSGYFYTLVPFLWIFGPNDWVVRLPSVLAGTATIYLVYLIAKNLSKREEWALWSAFLLAITPWHIQFSRAAFEVNLGTFFLTWGIFLLLKAREKPNYIIGAVFPLILSMYTYHGLRVLTPLLTLSLVLIYRKIYGKTRQLWIAGVLAILLMLPILVSLDSIQIRQRYNETSIFSTSKAVVITNNDRQEDGNTWLSRIWHHRYWLWSKEILAGMASQLSPGFLFISGDSNPRHQTGMTSLLYPWMIIPLILGILELADKEKRYGWLGLWVILATIPAALTNLTPHTLRFLPAVPAFALIMGRGMEKISVYIKGQKMASWLNGLMVLVISGSLIFYTYDLWWVYPKRESQNWQYGYRQVLQLIKSDYLNGKNIYFTRYYGRPSIYALWYLRIDPKNVQAETNLPHDQGELLRVGSMYFDDRPVTPGGTIVSENEITNAKLMGQVNFLDGKPAFYIYEN